MCAFRSQWVKYSNELTLKAFTVKCCQDYLRKPLKYKNKKCCCDYVVCSSIMIIKYWRIGGKGLSVSGEYGIRMSMILTLQGPNISMHIPYIFYGNDEENLFNNQNLCYLLITSFLLTTLMFDWAVLLWGEIKHSSLLKVKGLDTLILQIYQASYLNRLKWSMNESTMHYVPVSFLEFWRKL